MAALLKTPPPAGDKSTESGSEEEACEAERSARMKRLILREGLWLLPGCVYGWLIGWGNSWWQYQADVGLRRLAEVLLFGMVIGSLIYAGLWIPRLMFPRIVTAIKHLRGVETKERW